VGVVHRQLVRLVGAFMLSTSDAGGVVHRQLVRLIGVLIQHVSNRYLARRKRLPVFF